MICKKAEQRLLKSFDNRLNNEEEKALREHLAGCSSCQVLSAEYKAILQALKEESFPEPKPHFWERLEPRLNETFPFPLEHLWKRWGIRAIPVSVAVIGLVALVISLFFTPPSQELSQSGILLRNQNPFQETQPFLEEEEIGDKNIWLIFMAMEENGTRRSFP